MVEVYRELTSIAEKAGVRISTHHYHRPDRLLWNYQTMERLFNELQSPINGVTFCQGKSQMAGDDLVADILNYGDQIFMFHIRDVVTRVSGDVSPEVEKRLADLGYLEVAFGTGEVDMVGFPSGRSSRSTTRGRSTPSTTPRLLAIRPPALPGQSAIFGPWIRRSNHSIRLITLYFLESSYVAQTVSLRYKYTET